MPIRYRVIFPYRDSYGVRFWDPKTIRPSAPAGSRFDTKKIVPAEWWRSRGLETPHIESTRALTIAMQWAAMQVSRLEEEERLRASGEPRRSRGKMNFAAAFELYCRENPKKVIEETMARDRVSFAAIERTEIEFAGSHVTITELLPEEISELAITRYVNVRNVAKVMARRDGELIALDRKVRNRTINNEVELIIRIVRKAWHWREETGSAGMRIESADGLLLPAQESNQVALTPDQVGAVLPYLTRWKREAMIVGISLRLREKNLLGLRHEWFNRSQSWLDIAAEFMKKGRARVARPLSIPVPTIVFAQLGATVKGHVWTNRETGLPFTKISGLADAADEAGIPQFSIHDWRTTGSTWLDGAGVDELTIAVMNGQSSTLDASGQSFTVKRNVTTLYTKVMIEQLREAAAIYDVMFGKILKGITRKVVGISEGR